MTLKFCIVSLSFHGGHNLLYKLHVAARKTVVTRFCCACLIDNSITTSAHGANQIDPYGRMFVQIERRCFINTFMFSRLILLGKPPTFCFTGKQIV